MLRAVVRCSQGKAKQAASVYTYRQNSKWYFWMPHHQVGSYVQTPLTPTRGKKVYSNTYTSKKTLITDHTKIIPIPPQLKYIATNKQAYIIPIEDKFDPELTALVVPEGFIGGINVNFVHSYSGNAFFYPREYELKFFKRNIVVIKYEPSP